MLTKKGMEVLELLKQRGYTFNELKYELKSRRDLLVKYLNDIQLSGYDVRRKYYSDGRIRLTLPNSVEQNERVKSLEYTPIVTFSHENEFDALVISDLHLCCAGEYNGILDKVYEYATANGIHIIFGCGDILDGEEKHSATRFKTNANAHLSIQEQIEYLIKNYPYDKNILTFTVLGDHERLSEETNVIDIARAINNSRNDIIVSPNDLFKLGIKNETIYLTHKGTTATMSPSRIDIHGHSHVHESQLVSYRQNIFEKKLSIGAPTLSKIPNFGTIVPSMLRLHLKFDKMYISNVDIEELVLLNPSEGFKTLNVSSYSLPKKNTENVTTRYVEYYQPEHTSKILKKTLV